MRVLLSTHEPRVDVEPMPDYATAEECDALVATGVMPTGGRR